MEEMIADAVVETATRSIDRPLMGLAFAGGFVVGAVAGYFGAAAYLNRKFEDRMVEEIAEARTFYQKLNKVDESGKSVTPQEVAEATGAARKYQGRVEESVEEPVLDGEPYDEVVDERHIQKMEKMEKKLGQKRARAPKDVNVFRDDTFDLDEEMKHRDDQHPYIITHDEYFAAEKNYDMISVTYYEVDEVLTDERDKPLEEVDKLVGDEHLVRFGSGSKDKNIVYVRNDRLGIDYEICRSPGSYLEEVLGMPDENPGELKHSDQRDRRRAMRNGDD